MTDFWCNKRVFVTGATGLLGAWLCSALLKRGAEVTILLRDFVPGSQLVRSGDIARVTQVRGDLSSAELLSRAVGEYETQVVFHLGAQTLVGVANRDPLPTFEANVMGTANLLEACRRAGKHLQCVAVASSDKAYGASEVLPYDENTPLRGRHPYDVSKSCADLLAQSYAATYNLPTAIARCGNLFGGGDLNFSRLIPGTIASVLKDEAPLIRSNGEFVRDYLYVEDAVDAYLLMAQAVAQQAATPGACYNFSLQQPMSVRAIVALVCERMNFSGAPTILNEASHEIIAQHLSSQKAREELGFVPRFGLRDGLDETIGWYREFTKSA